MATAAASATFFGIGIVVLRLQADRPPGALRTLSYAMAVAYLVGSVLCLTFNRRALFAGATLVTAATLVPSHFTLAFPLAALIWGYVLTSNASPRSSVDDHDGSSPGAVSRT